MLLSHHRRFIFIHNYKVAGTSIRAALAPYQYSLSERLLRKIGKKPNAPLSHDDHLQATAIQQLIPSPQFEQYFKFGFVRNPWDWQVSLYRYTLQHSAHKQHEMVSKMSGFEEYMHWRVEHDVQLQKDFFYNENGECLVNFIGRFESLATDFQYICQQIGIKAQLPHHNKSRDDHAFLKHYNAATLALITQYYQEDIEAFGYQMPQL
ncbi:MAG: sulfotransferase family 2 domain-containing protein [Bacteroidota bacterium]